MGEQLEALRRLLELDERPERLECFDVSHTSGDLTVASCVVFGAEGPLKSDYRKFNIEGIEAGDDYGAIEQAVTRRYSRLKKGEARLPDVLFIDGGRGQLAKATAVLEELQIEGVLAVGIAKGLGRKAGRERLYVSGIAGAIQLPGNSPALHLVQKIRDEAHRFARRGTSAASSQAPGEVALGIRPRAWSET